MLGEEQEDETDDTSKITDFKTSAYMPVNSLSLLQQKAMQI